MDYRKILVTDGMSNDLLLFMTDVPMEKVVKFMIAVKTMEITQQNCMKDLRQNGYLKSF